MKLVELLGIETGLVPKDITGAAQAGQYLSLKNFRRATVIIQQGAWAGGTPAVTLKQAQAVAGTGEKAFTIKEKWSKVGTTGSAEFTRAAVSSDTFNLPAVANTITVLDIDAQDLDVENGFDCVNINVASPGANADLLCILVILSEPRYGGSFPPNPKVD